VIHLATLAFAKSRDSQPSTKETLMIQIFTALTMLLPAAHIFSSEALIETKEVYDIFEEDPEETQSFSEMFPELSDDERQRVIAFFSLDWKEAGIHQLPESHSTISLPEGYRLLIGEDARKAREYSGIRSSPELEAIVYADIQNTILFESYNEGYVSLNDWETLDSANLLKGISESTEEGNKERKEMGLEELHVVGWVQKPILDKYTKTIYWAIEGEGSEEGSFINSVALRLGREGYEKLIWITDKEFYIPFGGHLETMLQAHSFDPDYRYEDYTKGDRIASYGVATLVAATVGGKIVKGSGMLFFLKKISVLVIAAIASLFYKIKSFFNRNKQIKITSL
jgi:uncharacterized membrane-anchored protein